MQEVNLSCVQCGNDAFNVPNDHDDSFVVTCKTCGIDIGTVAQIEGAAKEALAGIDKESSSDDLKKAFRDAFKGLMTIRVE